MTEYTEKLKSYLEDSINVIVSKLEVKAKNSIIDDPKEMLGKLLNAAMKNEWETMMLSNYWVTTEQNLKFACSLSRLAGDEAKHLQLIESKVSSDFSFDGLYSPLYHHLLKLTDTFSRAVAGPFSRELLAVKRNELFLSFCEEHNFQEIMEIYREIQEEEFFHHQLGIKMIDELINNEEDFDRAKTIIDQLLKVVDDIHEIVTLKKGIHYIPGC